MCKFALIALCMKNMITLSYGAFIARLERKSECKPFIKGILMRISRYLQQPDENILAYLHMRDGIIFMLLIQKPTSVLLTIVILFLSFILT